MPVQRPCSYPSIFLLLLILLIRTISTLSQQSIAEGPEDLVTNVGAAVTLKCRVENQKGAVQWMKNGFGLGVDRQLKFFPRYSMAGSIANGEYNLLIENVTVMDDDVYACQISEADSEPAVVSNKAKLTVLVRPTIPRLQKAQHQPDAKEGDHILSAIAGEPISHSCISRKGRPPPKIGWAISSDSAGKHIISWIGETRAKFGHIYRNSRLDDSLEANVVEDIQRDSIAFSTMSNLTYVLKPEDDNRYLVCMSQHETFPDKVEVDTVKLSLQYAPRVNLTIVSPPSMHLREEGSALLACNVDAKPLDNIRIRWFRSGDEIPKHTTDTFAFESLKMEDHNAEYACEATNIIGTQRGSLKLNVAFSGRIMSTPQDKEVNEGDDVSFRCDSIGNPAPTTFWTKVGDDQILTRGDTLTIENVRTWQQGEYTCTVTVESFKSTQMTHTLHIRGPPTVSLDPEHTAPLGSTTEMSCKISGRPKPPEIKWTKNGKPLDFASGRMQVNQIPRPYGVESKLTIRNIQESDLGVYNCSSNNGLGTDRKGTVLRKRGLFDYIALLDVDQGIWTPLLVGLLAFLLFCCCFCCLCNRRRFRNDKKGHFVDENSDVTVKCEALDGQQIYFPEMYCESMENGNLIASKDYISIPQSNPDLDYIAAPSTTSFSNGGLYSKYLNPSMEYSGPMPLAPRYGDHSYGSFASGISTPGLSAELAPYPGDRLGGLQPPLSIMETLPEVDTPKASNYDFQNSMIGSHSGHHLMPDHSNRPLSRTSTHV
ncbi:hypothetical protein WR25_04044 [Diploscapter pachys]|uniref:Ig-like domain-containing protein n=1 Tax=Diploscapter pachys TaxID=2018661 RepID=A0A2A2KLM1_9BILA|nr:hypothetical protein WR25_04044 [Diploscapter pachys]